MSSLLLPGVRSEMYHAHQAPQNFHPIPHPATAKVLFYFVNPSSSRVTKPSENAYEKSYEFREDRQTKMFSRSTSRAALAATLLAWTAAASNTPVCLEMVLEDSFGDGWQGGIYTVSTTIATSLASGTLEDGSTQTDEVCVPGGDTSCYTMNVSNAGSNPHEISWSLGTNKGTVNGTAADEVDFYVSADGAVTQGSCTTSSTTRKPLVCPPGRFSVGTLSCENCSKGTYQPAWGQTLCRAADPGSFVDISGATSQQVCPPGTFSVGGSDTCDPCEVGEFQNRKGQTQCRAADTGYFVNVTGATYQQVCPPGSFSVGGAASCIPCSIGTFQNQEGGASCNVRAAM